MELFSSVIGHKSKFLTKFKKSIYTQIRSDISTCDYCQRDKIKGSKKVYVPIEDNKEYARVCYDLTSMDLAHRESVEIENSEESISNNWDDIISYDNDEPKSADKIYILLAIDCFTKYAVGRCFTTKRAVPIYTFLAKTYQGLPIKKFHCDNGKEFKNKVFDEFLKLFPGCVAAHGAPRTPTTQGAIERLNQTIKDKIRGLMAEDTIKKPLYEYLKTALENYNNEVHRALGKFTPSQASKAKPLFNQLPITNGNFYNVKGHIPESTPTQQIDYNIESILSKQSDKYKNSWTTKDYGVELKVNDKVLLLEKKNEELEVKLPMVNRKMQPKKPDKLIEDFLKQNVFYLNHYYEDCCGIKNYKEIIFTEELLSLKQTDAAKVLNITTKSILKLLRHAINEADLSKHYSKDERKITWPRRTVTSPLMVYVYANKGISVKCVFKNEK
ncbi:hypothetical protein ACTFIR_012266 [Dictyostelium discoideum]